MYTTRKFLFYFLFLGITAFIINCQRDQSGGETSIPNDIKWIRLSIEYQAICIQIYRCAWEAVKIANSQLNENWAVILDIDETVLDNSPYEEMLIEKGLKYPVQWDEWVNSANAEPIPGVKAFLDSTRSLGKFAHVVFITNRNAAFEKVTVENLKFRDLWSDNDLILCRQDKGDTKEVRRNEVITGTGRCSGMGGWKIIVLIGDQLPDVANYSSGLSPEELSNTFKDSPIWGSQSFVLPNPMYGSWLSGY
jgi:5'-nucleotidase (lipoprotein e(P4) family)